MTLNLSKTLLMLSASTLLLAATATSSDARQHAKRLNTPQSEAVYDRSDSNMTRDRDSSCFTSVPAMFGCSANGG